MYKLILDLYTKSLFSFSNEFSKHVDGMSVGSILDPTLLNIRMTELEKIIAT